MEERAASYRETFAYAAARNSAKRKTCLSPSAADSSTLALSLSNIPSALLLTTETWHASHRLCEDSQPVDTPNGYIKMDEIHLDNGCERAANGISMFLFFH